MKQLLAILLIGISSSHFACGDEATKHYNQGVAYEKQGKYDLAIESFKRAIDINPDYAEVHYNLGLAYHNQGKYDLAIESFKRAISIDPDLAKAYGNLGVTYEKQGKYDLLPIKRLSVSTRT